MERYSINRRAFARQAGIAAGLGLTPMWAQQRTSPNDRIRMGFIGVGEMGSANLQDMVRTGQIDVVAIADPYRPHLERALSSVPGKAKGYKDFRKIIDDPNIDAVCVSTPEHWHAIPTIMACDAGKDVYVEKPLSHTVHEGQRMVEAAKRRNRIVQVGTQQRSGAHFQKAVEMVRSGALGKVMRVDTWNNWNRPVDWLGAPPDSDPPEWLDWDLWLGPAPYHGYNVNRCISNFRWFWDYANGMLGDWGVHLLDIVHWAMEVKTPKTVSFAGGKWVFNNNTETPDTFEVQYVYPQSPVSAREFLVTFSCRFVNSHSEGGRTHGIQFFGTEGTMLLDRGGFTVWPEPDRSGGEPVAAKGPIQSGSSAQHYPHVLNFLECVRSRKQPRSDIETMYYSTLAPLIGVVSQKVGRRLTWDAEHHRFAGDDEANKYLTKAYRKPWNVA
ncbi:MAG: Gfo/Idh/MocA family protein [Candidatus Methylomirabilaceae bacterium]